MSLPYYTPCRYMYLQGLNKVYIGREIGSIILLSRSSCVRTHMRNSTISCFLSIINKITNEYFSYFFASEDKKKSSKFIENLSFM